MSIRPTAAAAAAATAAAAAAAALVFCVDLWMMWRAHRATVARLLYIRNDSTSERTDGHVPGELDRTDALTASVDGHSVLLITASLHMMIT